MINRLKYQIVENSYLNFMQKFRAIIFKIWGEEALFEVDKSESPVHNHELNIDIFPLGPIELSMLAKRKLFNPFKLVEVIISLPLELIAWFFVYVPNITQELIDLFHVKHQYLYWVLAPFEFLFRASSKYIISPVLFVLSNLILGALRRLLSPVRTIIRPSLEMLFTNKEMFLFTLIFALGLIAVTFVSIYTGLIVLPAFMLGIGLGVKILLDIAFLSVNWAVAVKITAFVTNAIDAIQLFFNPKILGNEIITSINDKNTTNVSEILHGLNHEIADIKDVSEQSNAYKFALFTGTEAVFYPKNKQNIKNETNEVKQGEKEEIKEVDLSKSMMSATSEGIQLGSDKSDTTAHDSTVSPGNSGSDVDSPNMSPVQEVSKTFKI